jgi:outer membrane receptor protein involved in Fe transport
MFVKSQLTIALLAVLSMPVMAIGQDAASPGQEEPARTPEEKAAATTTLDAVSVTGSRIARSQVEGPSAVTVISGADIQKQGFSTVRDALTTINQSTGNVDTDMDQTGGTPNGQFINLRGMGPGYTLVLLNGKRMANYPQAYDFRSAAVSLSSIPAGAVERIEVLSGGSSAIYGSDAVAGVINIITKAGFDGDQLRLRVGTTHEGGGDSALLQWTGGKSGDRWTATYAFEYQAREAILAHQRDFMDSSRDNPAFRDDPSRATTLEAVYLNRVGLGYVWPDADGNLSGSLDALRHACSATNAGYEHFVSGGIDRCGDFAYDAQYSVQNKVNQVSGLLAGTYDISDSTSAYFNALASRSENRSYNKSMFHFYMSPANVYDPELGVVTLRRRFTPGEIGGQDPMQYHERAFSFNAGLRGAMFGERFDWDVGVSHSAYDLTIDRRFLVTSRVRDYFLGELAGYTPDGLEIRDIQVDRLFSPLDRETFNSISTVFTNRGESAISSAQFVMSGDLFDLPAGTVRMAAVAEAGRETFELRPDVRTTPDYAGNERIFNWTAVTGGGERDRYAVGIEFNVPILASLTGSLAGRYDMYDDASDVGGAFTWQAGLEWRPLDSLLLRGAYATSFRAPDMTYLYSGASSNFYWLTDVYRCRLDGIDPSSPACTSGSSDYYNQVQGTYSGNLRLEEEKGDSLTFGVVWDISDAMSLSADYYRISLDGAVAEMDRDYLMHQDADCRLGQTLAGAQVDGNSPSCQFYRTLISRNDAPGGNNRINAYASYPINQSLMRTSGVDVAWRYGLDIGSWGKLSLKAGYTIVTKLESQLFPGDALVNERDSLQHRNFRSKANWQANWSKDDWQASMYGYRLGSLPNFANTGRIGSHVVWNATVSKAITPKATLGIGINNLFNKFHPADNTYTTYPYFHKSYSPVGRQVYAELGYDF